MFLLVNTSIPCKIKGHNKKGHPMWITPIFYCNLLQNLIIFFLAKKKDSHKVWQPSGSLNKVIIITDVIIILFCDYCNCFIQKNTVNLWESFDFANTTSGGSFYYEKL